MRLATVWGAWLIFSCCTFPAYAAFTPRIFTAANTAAPPTLDGNLTEPMWSTTQAIDQFYAYQSGGSPAAATGRARFLWDSQYLYVGLEMNDVEIRSSCGLANQCGNDAALFNGDVIELFIKQLPGRTKYFEFEWSPRGEIFDARFNNTQDPRWNTPPGSAFDANITAAVQVDGIVDNPAATDHSWTVETAISLADLELTNVVPGMEWFFTVARYDYYNNPTRATPALMMSTPGDPSAPNGGVTYGFHSYEIYDILRLSPVPEPTLGLFTLVLVGFGAASRLPRRTI